VGASVADVQRVSRRSISERVTENGLDRVTGGLSTTICRTIGAKRGASRMKATGAIIAGLTGALAGAGAAIAVHRRQAEAEPMSAPEAPAEAPPVQQDPRAALDAARARLRARAARLAADLNEPDSPG
jgi:hypothetical protein